MIAKCYSKFRQIAQILGATQQHQLGFCGIDLEPVGSELNV